MARTASYAFTDPIPFQGAFTVADVDLCVTRKGKFASEFTTIDFGRLWISCGHERLPRVYRATVTRDRAVILFLSRPGQSATRHCGVEVKPAADIIVDGLGATVHHRTSAPCHWGAMSLTTGD